MCVIKGVRVHALQALLDTHLNWHIRPDKGVGQTITKNLEHLT